MTWHHIEAGSGQHDSHSPHSLPLLLATARKFILMRILTYWTDALLIALKRARNMRFDFTMCHKKVKAKKKKKTSKRRQRNGDQKWACQSRIIKPKLKLKAAPHHLIILWWRESNVISMFVDSN